MRFEWMECTPGKKNGDAVPSLILIEVTFGD